ncbi:membrane protein of unknown function [Candidatus Hydrogenisulfobacillus filiaventi]|uniref:Cation/H+ exchanger transmembrane domain-containing protein n=1 Tax=Candidatus Hydrogenisulfobacillus filiaventi TaxID=2707344 RepID=A0A6F8ZJB8_9FIRM|nr:membrane protein of unknown function [Candidatus Hydrogenisulfobacillus filiaventi]
MSQALQPVLVVALLAVTAPALVNRLPGVRIPVAVAEILLGVVFGRSGLGLVTPSPVIRFLALFGLAYLMFLIGLEANVERLWQGTGPAGGAGRPVAAQHRGAGRLHQPAGRLHRTRRPFASFPGGAAVSARTGRAAHPPLAAPTGRTGGPGQRNRAAGGADLPGGHHPLPGPG